MSTDWNPRRETDDGIGRPLFLRITAVRRDASPVSRYGADGEVETFVEVVEPRLPLFIFDLHA
jgi:hypothetical protein